MRERWNGSIQSANTPTMNQSGARRDDYAMYRCMITKVVYIDDPANITMNSRNPSVLYEAVILGGFNTGQTLFPCRLASWLGGTNNYADRTLQATSKMLSTTSLANHDGDIVYVTFNQGHDAYPTIIATDKGLNDNVSGIAAADGPRSVSQYNGVNKLINNQGEYIITRKGGTLDPDLNVFTPDDAIVAQFSMIQDIISLTDTGSTFSITKSLDQIQLITAGGAGIKAKAGTIAVGTSAVELLEQISQQLDKISMFMKNIGAAHTHIGNLGYDTAPPDQASDYTQLGSDLSDIKGKVDSIKGTF